MTKPNINIPDKIFCDKYDISMVSYLSLFLYDQKAILFGKDQNQKIVTVHQFSFSNLNEFKDIIKNNTLFALDIPTLVFVHTEHFSLIPGMLYDPAYSFIYMSFAGNGDREVEVFNTSLESNNLQLVGSLDKNLYNSLRQHKSEISFHHGSASFLSYTLTEKVNLIDQELFVQLFDNNCYVTAYLNQELILLNRFTIENKEILIKYLLGIIHQIKFNRKHCKVTFLGQLENLDISQSWGEEYFMNFKTPTPKTNQYYQKGLEVFKESNMLETIWQLQ